MKLFWYAVMETIESRALGAINNNDMNERWLITDWLIVRSTIVKDLVSLKWTKRKSFWN